MQIQTHTTESAMIGPRTMIVEKFMEWLLQQNFTNNEAIRAFITAQIELCEGNERRNAQRMLQLFNKFSSTKQKNILKVNKASTKVVNDVKTSMLTVTHPTTATKQIVAETLSNQKAKRASTMKTKKETLPENGLSKVLIQQSTTIPEKNTRREEDRYHEARSFLKTFIANYSNKIREFNPLLDNDSLKHIVYAHPQEKELFVITYVTNDNQIELKSIIYDYNEDQNNPSFITSSNTKSPIVILNKFGRPQKIMQEDENGTKYWVTVLNQVDNFHILLSLKNFGYDSRTPKKMTLMLKDGLIQSNAHLTTK